MKSVLLVKKFLGLVEMTSGLVNASFSLPEWQAVKMIFFTPCCCLKVIASLVNYTVTCNRFFKLTSEWRDYFGPYCLFISRLED